MIICHNTETKRSERSLFKGLFAQVVLLLFLGLFLELLAVDDKGIFLFLNLSFEKADSALFAKVMVLSFRFVAILRDVRDATGGEAAHPRERFADWSVIDWMQLTEQLLGILHL